MDLGFDLNLLRVLVALDQTRSVTRAAQALDMSQSGFSTALARLRRRFGDPIFVRTRGGMEPTPRARAMVEAARTILVDVQRGVLEPPVFDAASAQGEWHLAMADVAEIVFLPRLLRQLQSAAPQMSVHSMALPRVALQEAMERGTVDLALGYFPELGSQSFFQQRLYTHTYACMLRPSHPALRARLSEKVYLELGHAVVASPARSTELFDRFLDRKGLQRRIVLQTPHHMSLPAIIEETDLIATVPLATGARYARLGAVDLAPLPFPPPSFEVKQYWHRRTHQDARARWLRTQVASLFNDDTDEWRAIERRLYGELRKARRSGVAQVG